MDHRLATRTAKVSQFLDPVRWPYLVQYDHRDISGQHLRHYHFCQSLWNGSSLLIPLTNGAVARQAFCVLEGQLRAMAFVQDWLVEMCLWVERIAWKSWV